MGLGCSSTPPVKTQAYAKLKNERTFESEFPLVWKAIEEVLRNHRIKDRDPEYVDATELQKISNRSLRTDWIYGKSRDKYQEYQVNGFPRKNYLQTRFNYSIEVKKVMGGVNVRVVSEEEIERLNTDGSSAGFTGANEPDPSRPNELLDKIQTGILAAPVL